ncbi:hypothetical protein E2C01_019738 [Portunus trituberculatus]|uniref:Uncharacterized protein n=1 Tax=Portunus trituberculatus TaxID=210409 RepID=A0A5B7DZG9_PORTR|nr:hypothetical protein [Portunus trituberculatus]
MLGQSNRSTRNKPSQPPRCKADNAGELDEEKGREARRGKLSSVVLHSFLAATHLPPRCVTLSKYLTTSITQGTCAVSASVLRRECGGLRWRGGGVVVAAAGGTDGSV